MAAPGLGPGGPSLLGGARTWPLKRYGRFRPPAEGGDEGPNASSWKVFESNEESGQLILTIVVSGHFFISQGRTVLEGFSLIDSHKWLKVVRRADCLLLRAQAKGNLQNYLNKVRNPTMLNQPVSALADLRKERVQQKLFEQRKASCKVHSLHPVFIELTPAPQHGKRCKSDDTSDLKNECRMFRVQFGGDSKAQMLEHCCGCVQKLAEYVPVQVPEEQSQQLTQLGNSEDQGRDPEQSASGLHTPDEPLPDSCTSLGERRSVTQLAQSVLKKKSELPLVYQHAVWRPQELGPFIRLCLMDQSFPAFVEDVEKELKKLAEG